MNVEARLYEEAIKRAHGDLPIVLTPDPEKAAPALLPPVAPAKPVKPLASSLAEAHFARRARTAGVSEHTVGQERATLRMFVEVAGGRPVDTYDRGHIARFLDRPQRLPSTYGKSRRDKDMTVAKIIAEADERGSARRRDRQIAVYSSRGVAGCVDIGVRNSQLPPFIEPTRGVPSCDLPSPATPQEETR